MVLIALNEIHRGAGEDFPLYRLAPETHISTHIQDSRRTKVTGIPQSDQCSLEALKSRGTQQRQNKE